MVRQVATSGQLDFNKKINSLSHAILEGVLGDLVGVEVNDSSEYIDAWFLEITNDKLLKRRK